MTNSKLLIAVLALFSTELFHVEGFSFNGNKALTDSNERGEPHTKQRHQINYYEPHKYKFPPVNKLPEQKGLPDSFLMYGGSRVKTIEKLTILQVISIREL